MLVRCTQRNFIRLCSSTRAAGKSPGSSTVVTLVPTTLAGIECFLSARTRSCSVYRSARFHSTMHLSIQPNVYEVNVASSYEQSSGWPRSLDRSESNRSRRGEAKQAILSARLRRLPIDRTLDALHHVQYICQADTNSARYFALRSALSKIATPVLRIGVTDARRFIRIVRSW